ncbi:AAA family ATPase [Flavobacterium silvaticum]|uniref:ATP-binding protein n=1 Tax=Flavobacterium silvaticum TaxID=1852020 RepID=A0A972JIC0_9FLAO|nr:ATP-binding protein [Flavobacterium silvaticum]NMH28048.1 ATP-binding protein [Flavobacterium silvaticum]
MKKIVIIGGPGSGKSTLIEALEQKGYHCLPEISREVTMAAQRNGVAQLFLEQPLLFSELLLEGRIKQFHEAAESGAELVFIDRGIPDVLAYMHYIGDSYPAAFDTACREYKYDGIFMLPPWEEIYQSDNERYENFEQALLIHEHLLETYRRYGYDPIMVPKDTVENRVAFVLSALKN